MLRDAVLVPGLVHRINFSGPTGFCRLLDAEARHLLLNMRLSEPEGQIFINTQRDGAWGEPMQISLSADGVPDRLSVFFKLTETLEIWNARDMLAFERFDAETGKEVRYCVLKNAANPGETLKLSVPRPEEMAAQIATQVAMRRLDALERKLPGGLAPASE